MLHSSTSTNNPTTFFEIFRHAVSPFFTANPAPAALKVGRWGHYVAPESPSLYVRDGSLRYFAITAQKSAAFALRCAFLRATGKPEVARRLAAGWRAFKIYRGSKLDFGLLYCGAQAAKLSLALPEKERSDFAPLFEGDWAEYEFFHCRVITNKYFAKVKVVEAVEVVEEVAARGPRVAPAALVRLAPAVTAPATVFATSADDFGEGRGGGGAALQQQRQMSTILRTISSIGVACP